MRSATVLAILLLSGCLASPGTPPANDIDAPEPETATLRLGNCIHQLAFIGIPAAEASERVPDGFDPVLLAEGLAQLVVLATGCQTVENGTDGAQEILAAIGVVPPADVARDDVEFHAFYVHLITDRADLWSHYAAWNIPGETGTVVMDISAGGAGAGTSTAAGITLTTVVGGTTSEGPAGAVRIFTKDGTGAVDYDFTPYQMILGGATLNDAEGVLGFAPGRSVGYGVHEWGDDYGLVLTRIQFDQDGN